MSTTTTTTEQFPYNAAPAQPQRKSARRPRRLATVAFAVAGSIAGSLAISALDSSHAVKPKAGDCVVAKAKSSGGFDLKKTGCKTTDAQRVVAVVASADQCRGIADHYFVPFKDPTRVLCLKGVTA